MAKMYNNGYQICDLKQAAAALVSQVPGLQIDIDWAGQVSPAVISMPKVEFTIVFGRQQSENHPASTVAVNLSDALNLRLGTLAVQHAALITTIQNCPVT